MEIMLSPMNLAARVAPVRDNDLSGPVTVTPRGVISSDGHRMVITPLPAGQAAEFPEIAIPADLASQVAPAGTVAVDIDASTANGHVEVITPAGRLAAPRPDRAVTAAMAAGVMPRVEHCVLRCGINARYLREAAQRAEKHGHRQKGRQSAAAVEIHLLLPRPIDAYETLEELRDALRSDVIMPVLFRTPARGESGWIEEVIQPVRL